MRLSDLQNKDVIDINGGKKVGNIIDITLFDNGQVATIIVEPIRRISKLFLPREEFEIQWSSIVKFGEDVILIKTI